MFTWIASFFSNEAHLNLAVSRFQSAARCATIVRENAIAEGEYLEEYYKEARADIDNRLAQAEKLSSALAAFV